MNPDATKISMHATFLAAALAVHALTISAQPSPALSLPMADAWADAAQVASSCVDEQRSSGYLSDYSALLIATAGGDGTPLVPSC